MTSRTVLFFGSFNPIHRGHLQIARYMLDEGYGSRVWFVVSPQNPWKADAGLLEEGRRLEMVRRAIAGDARMEACDVEFAMPRPSYTYRTLCVLRNRYPGREFALAIGGDNLERFPEWRQAEDILTEVRGIAERGFREIVLTGIHISSYGIDFDDEAWKRGESVPMRRGDGLVYRGAGKLVELVELLCQIPGIERIRLGSLEPRIVTEEAVRRLAALPKLCPHFHLSLQSGCDATLKRMNRHYTTREYYSSVELLRRAFSHPAITTDVIVGFPGETEEEFAETERFLEKVCFYEMHIFRYSKRQGTAAAELPGQVPEDVKAARSDRLFEMERRQSQEFRRTYIGQEVEILTEDTEEIDGKLWRVGHTRDYVKVATEEKEARHSNAMKRVRVQGFLTDKMLAAVPAQ